MTIIPNCASERLLGPVKRTALVAHSVCFRVIPFPGSCLVLALVAVALRCKERRVVETRAATSSSSRRGAGGGSDEVARLVQRICRNGKLVEVPLAVVEARAREGRLRGPALTASGRQSLPLDQHGRTSSPTISPAHPLNSTDLTRLRSLQQSPWRSRGCAPTRRSGTEGTGWRLKADASSLSAAAARALATRPYRARLRDQGGGRRCEEA